LLLLCKLAACKDKAGLGWRHYRRRRIRRSRDTSIRRRNKGGERSHIREALYIEPPGNTARVALSKPAAAPTIRSTRRNRVKRQDDQITPQLLSGQADGEGRHPQLQAKRPDARAKARRDNGAAAVRRWTGRELPPAMRPDIREKARRHEWAAAFRRWMGREQCVYSSASWIISDAMMFSFIGLLFTCSHEL
jgi:hypothetical protein